jgi:hypothetical protein
MRFHEKGGKGHEMPCNHNLEAYIDGKAVESTPTLPVIFKLGK